MECKNWINFKWESLTESNVVDRLLSISNELKVAYKYYQELLWAYHIKQPEIFFQLLHEIPKEVPMELHNIKKTSLGMNKVSA